MSEPNDTAREGFDQLKRNLEVRYPEDSDLSLDEFLNVESLLALAVRVCGPGADPRKADRLLSNYQLIRPETIGADGHLMQMARRHLFSLASSTAWRRLLGLYERAEYERYRFFDIANGGMALREHPLTGIDRMPIYIDRLLGDVKLSHKNVVARPKGRYSYTCKPEATGDTTVTGSIRWVTMPDAVPPQTGKIDDIPRKSRRPPIDITLDELISTADEVGEKTGKTHYAAVLRRVKDQGLLKRARGGSTSVADGLRLDEVVSLVGLVGAGKSVLANMLIVCLAKRGLRAVSLLNSVSDVMESVVLLREAGISASPLVSRGRRIERLDEFFDHDDSMLLGHSASKYLETACIMDGLSSSDPEACGYGSTPCRGLRSKKGGANSCPYWDVCPSQAMARESLTSDVVVTTPTGFATMIVGRERKAFFEEALQQFDVVLFDEADRVQAQLDGCFAPSMSFQELIRNAADPTAAAMKRRPDDKMRDFNEELFYDLRQKSEPVAKALLKSVRDDRVAKWRIVKDEAFTSLSLLNDLLEQGLPKQVYEDADKLINPYRFEIAKKSLYGGDAALNKLSQAVATSCEGIDDDTHSYSLNEYLAACGCSELPDELRTRFSFALKVIRFDSYLRELASAQDLLSFKDDSVDELYNFLKFSYTRQQHYLPNSLIGNIFGMKLDGNDLRLFRQFAFGRAFMCSLPWLDTDPAGAALGPHVLLLSGSSWEPGCLQYHVNRPVDYLLEAEPWKAAKLSTSTVRDLGIEQNVSGSAAEMRSGNLGIVLSQTMATLKDELDADGAGKALVIVNSYREAEDARDRIEQEFRRKGQAIKVAALVRNNHDHRERFVPRSEVYKFCDHPAKVLVAPAMAIERGFNIVDRGGRELDLRCVERVNVLAVDRIGDAVVGAQHQRVLRQVGAGALRVRVEVIEARRVADAGAVQVVDEIGVGLAHDRLEDVRLEIEAGPVPRLEAPALEVSGIELHQQRGVAFGHDRRQLEEIADEDHLLRAVARHGLGDHPHHVVEQVDAAHRDLVDDDYLRGVEHLAGPLGAIGGADPRRDFQRAVDRRAVREVQRGDAGGRQGEEIDVARLQVRYEGVEHVALTRAGVAREKHVPPVPQRAHRLGLFRCKAVTVCHFHIPSSVRPVTGN